MDIKEEIICILCFNAIENDYEVVDDVFKEMFDVLLLKRNFDVSKSPIVCGNCAEITKKCHEFKANCTKTEKLIHSLSADKKEFVLNNVYEDIDKNFSVCRFCMIKANTSNFVSMDSLMDDAVFSNMLPVFFPDMDLNVVKNASVCTSCIGNLDRYFKFAQHSSVLEKKISTCCQNEDTNSVGQAQLSIKKEEISYEDVDPRPELCDQVKTEYAQGVKHEGNLNIRKTRTRRNDLPKKIYYCKLCVYRTKSKNVLKKHVLKHKNTSTIKKYKCALCPYRGKYESHLKTHMLVHRDNSEGRLYSCTFCTHGTNRKHNLDMHMRTHREMYECSSCDYWTNLKKDIDFHMHRIHNVIAKVKCSECSYETRYKVDLMFHALSHQGKI